MKTNVFWGIVGGVVLGWLILLGILIYPRWSTYSEKKAEVTSTVSKLAKLAKRKESELPTDQLLERKEKKISNFEASLEEAREWYAARDARFEDTQGQDNLASWKNVVYEDGFRKLEEAYRERFGVAEGDKLPFERFKNMDDPSSLTTYQKHWNLQRTVIQAALDHGGDIEKYEKKDKPDEKLGLRHPEFESVQSFARLWLPPSSVKAYLNELLNDETINFSFYELAVTKAKNNLIRDLVEPLSADKEPMSEPLVRCYLAIDAQDWAPRADGDGKEE